MVVRILVFYGERVAPRSILRAGFYQFLAKIWPLFYLVLCARFRALS